MLTRDVQGSDAGMVLDERAALAQAWDDHAGELYRFARRALGDPGAAEDVVQDVFLKAWRARSTYDPARSSTRTWLWVIARNAVLDAHRHRAGLPELVDLGGDDVVHKPARDPVDAMLASAVVTEALKALDPVHRDVLIQTRLLGRPYAEVAAAGGVPVGTVKSRVFYALRALRGALQERGVEL